MLSIEETQLKLKDLRQALSYEKDHRYIDVQGRKKTFSRFVCDTLKELQPVMLGEETEQLDALRRKFENYQFMDVGGRMSAMESIERFLEHLAHKSSAPQRKVTTVKPAAGSQSIHEMDVKFLKGVGPRLAQLLGQVGIETVENLLYYFPRRYLDYNNRVKILELEQGQEVTVIGAIRSVNAYNAKSGHVSILNVTIADETGMMSANWFMRKSSQAALEVQKARYPKGADVMVSGKVKWDTYKRLPAMDQPQLEILSYQDASGAQESDSLHAGRIVPIYALTEGLNLRFLRKAIHQALQDYLGSIIDPMPPEILKKHRLMGLREALRQIHFPETKQMATAARERLVFDELFYLQLRLALMRQQYKRTVKGLSLTCKPDGYAEQLRNLLPFDLTGAQKRVLAEIHEDIASSEPMYRMLQGDVGSGKTIVAILTLLAAVENGYQGALMAPTEILAEQHYGQR